MQGLEIYKHMHTINMIVVEGLEWELLKNETIKQLNPLKLSIHQDWVEQID